MDVNVIDLTDLIETEEEFDMEEGGDELTLISFGGDGEISLLTLDTFPQLYPLGTLVWKFFYDETSNYRKFVGVITSYDSRYGWYTITYPEDGDCEEMDEYELDFFMNF